MYQKHYTQNRAKEIDEFTYGEGTFSQKVP